MRRGAIALTLAAALAGAAGCAHSPPRRSTRPDFDVHHYRSRPDLARPALTVERRPEGTAPGYLFLAPKPRRDQRALMIVDDAGRLVWERRIPQPAQASAFQVQRYRGEPVLTWWEGRKLVRGHGEGDYLVFDASYRQIARVRAGRRIEGDHHDFQLTPQGTALMTVYDYRRADLSSVGGPRHGTVVESMIREVDVATGRVVFKWRSLDHVGVEEGVTRPHGAIAHDYFHINSIDVDRDGNLIVSARNTDAVYKIDRRTGAIIWRLGGKRSDFRLGPGARFAFQHDARRRVDGTLSLFDNEATPRRAPQSRGLVLALDEHAKTARVVHQYVHPEKLLSSAEGNVQTLPDGHVLIGWGQAGHVSEFAPDGRILYDLGLPPRNDTYQAFRFPWTGRPADSPAIAAQRNGTRVRVFASWNGATEVTRWELLAGETPDGLAPVTDAERSGFETEIDAASGARYVAARALDAAGRVLGTSAAREPAPG